MGWLSDQWKKVKKVVKKGFSGAKKIVKKIKHNLFGNAAMTEFENWLQNNIIN